MVVARGWWVGALAVIPGVLACSSESPPSANGGAAGEAKGGSSVAGSTSGVGGSRNAAGRGGQSGSSGAKAQAAAGQGVAGSSALAGAGAGAGVGAGGSAGANEAKACGGVRMLGRCAGQVYEWCDYFARGIQRIDCGALGMQCRAEPQELGSDFPSAGCFGAACTSADEHCDGTIAYQCGPEGLSVHDCSKRFGPETSCGPGQLGAATCAAPYCEPETHVHCDGSVAVVCALDHNFYVEDCAEHDPAGTCTEIDPMQVECGGTNIQPI